MAPPKIILQLYPMLPAEDEFDRARKRPLGRNRELYNKVLHDWMDIVNAAEELGVWGASSIEHHLHSEGYEVGPNPGVINAWWAGQVRRINIGAMGYVMATQDPIRVAEETAIIDHLARGRYFVGFARGYQSRWTNVLGQFTNTTATLSDSSADDEHNREVFEERVGMVLKCWQQDTVELNGKYYQAPYPYDTGVVGYPAWRTAQRAGAQGEVDENGALRRVSVVPAPYQRPHPPVFVAVAKSEPSVRFCARNGFRCVHFTKLDAMLRLSQLYVEEGRQHGYDYALGERQCAVRWFHIGKTEEEFREKLIKYDLDIYKNFYAPFFPQLPSGETIDWTKNLTDSGIITGGTLEKTRAEFQKIYSQIPCEYITVIFHYAQQPKEDVIWELEQFMTKIVPTLEAAQPRVKAA
jgi:alkanesulfonate monooxygenase SsuD/methylene tetrahydromethanopterin reductase-like flavin-dependent oxidoreductase (luciferase family)